MCHCEYQLKLERHLENNQIFVVSIWTCYAPFLCGRIPHHKNTSFEGQRTQDYFIPTTLPPTPHPWTLHPLFLPPLRRVLCTVLVAIPWAGQPRSSLIEFQKTKNTRPTNFLLFIFFLTLIKPIVFKFQMQTKRAGFNGLFKHSGRKNLGFADETLRRGFINTTQRSKAQN